MAPLKGRSVTVLGAGVAGLAVATLLARAGAEVCVLEQADAIREVGAGLQISPNGMAVLRAMGLEPALAAVSPRARAVVLRSHASGAEVLRLDLGRVPGPFYLVHRADLIGLLAGAAQAAGVQVRLGQHIVGLELDALGAQLATAQGQSHRCNLLIGADGLHSIVRAALNGYRAPAFTGQVAWRALVPADEATKGGAAPLPEAQVHMGPGRHLVHYPLRDGRLINIVAVEERRAWAEEGWNHPDDPAALRAAFAGFSAPLRALLERVEAPLLWGLFRHPVAARWHQGAAAILGDAAHPTLPFLAQGANMALEDAWVLAAALAAHPSHEAAFGAYQQARRPRTLRLVEAATRNARNYHLRAPLRPLAHAALRLGGSLAAARALDGLGWVYTHDVTAGGAG